MANVKVRGCCCGIPFGFGILGVLAGAVLFAGPLLPEVSLSGTLLALGRFLAISGLL